MKKKKKKALSDLFVFVFIFFFLTVFVIGIVHLYVPWIKYQSIETIARSALLKVETKGYMTQNDKQALLTQLRNNGYKNVSLDGTTFREVEYGSDVKVVITYDYESTDFSNIFNGMPTVSRRTTITRESICKK